MSRKKSVKKPEIPRKNLLQMALFREKGDAEDRGTLLLRFREIA
jgi:hypothetical protein